MSHDRKKELMVQFCIAYYGILCRHNLCATATTGRFISEATSLQVTKFLSGIHGGTQQIASRIGLNEIDLLLFFRDPLLKTSRTESEYDLLRLCDIHSIPVATNIATAEVLIRGLERGDMDWRDIVNPSRR